MLDPLPNAVVERWQEMQGLSPVHSAESPSMIKADSAIYFGG
jgi:hypothetical protein